MKPWRNLNLSFGRRNADDVHVHESNSSLRKIITKQDTVEWLGVCRQNILKKCQKSILWVFVCGNVRPTWNIR